MSFKPEMRVKDEADFVGNQLVFATEKQSDDYAWDLFMRWTQCTECRSVPSDEPVNAEFVDGQLYHLPPKESGND
jgi:hypothetical protein